MILNPEMAELQQTEEDGDEEELLRDSLDSANGSVSSETATDETTPKEVVEEKLGPVEVVATHDDTLIKEPLRAQEQKIEHLNVDEKANEVLKTSKKRVILLHKNGPSKGRQKMNYSEIYHRRLKQKGQRSESSTLKTNGVRENITTLPSSTQANQTAKNVTGLPEKIKQDYLLSENETGDNYLQNGLYPINSSYIHSGTKLRQKCDQAISDHFAYDETFENDCKLELSESFNREHHGPNHQNKSMQSDNNISPIANAVPDNYHNLHVYRQGIYTLDHDSTLFETEGNASTNPLSYIKDVHLQVTPYSHSVQEFPTSFQSAPADMYTYNSNFDNPQYKVPNKASSVCAAMGGKDPSFHSKLDDTMTSASSSFKANGKPDTTSYSAIYALKQNTYQPYTLSDYQRLKHTSPSGLGPDTNSEEYKHKVKKVVRQKEYAAVLRQKHVLDKGHWKKSPGIVSTQKRSPQTQDANARRQKALQYAKAVPKPATTKRQTSEVKAEVDHQEPTTLLDILRQRHEREKKAIDAVRKDLDAKLKTK